MIACSEGRGHLNGVRPLGASLHTGVLNIRDRSLGRFAVLTDELVLQVLDKLSAIELAQLNAVSKALYCFSNHEDLWKALVIEVRVVFCRCYPVLAMFSPSSGVPLQI